MSVRLLLEDDSLVVCEKPVGTLSEEEMPALLREACGCDFIGVVHRLDRGVGGVMVFAKTPKAAAALSSMVQERRLQKEYLAVVHGAPKEACGEWRDLLFRDAHKNKSFVVDRQRKGVREAVLSYELRGSATDERLGTVSLVSIRLQTGRSHQIRVQFASRRLPLVGDGKYGGRDNGFDIALWSHRLAFPHPVTGKPTEISLPPPGDSPWNLFR